MLNQLMQYVPSDFCLRCDTCCRFLDKKSQWSPIFTKKEVSDLLNLKDLPARRFTEDKPELIPYYKDLYICPFFSSKDNKCLIYSMRPFDCQLYPFILTYQDKTVFLGVDKKCPFIKDKIKTEDFKKYTEYLIDFLTSKEVARFIYDNPYLISQLKDDLVLIASLKALSRPNEFKKIGLKDKSLIQRYLNLENHSLSNFSFANLFIWKSLFEIFWEILDDNLCIFFKNPIGCFMYLPPLGKKITKRTTQECFQIMDDINEDKTISRIENVECKDLKFYNEIGLNHRLKNKEYIYKNNNLIDLSGNRYKSKRSSCNYFLNNYNYEYLEFSTKMKDECLKLYNDWKIQRKEKYKDSIYQQMLEDSSKVNTLSMDYYEDLDLVGRVVKIDNKIKAYTFGYRLNKDTFCILIEIADLKIKGLAQFIFRMFCGENKKFTYINTMDNSGLDNLQKVKLSYRPYKLECSYLIAR